MQIQKNKMRFLIGMLAGGSLLLAGCNREFEEINPVSTTPGTVTGSSIGDIINTDTSYSFFKELVTKAGAAAPVFTNKSLQLTAFIPNNAAFRLSGFQSVTALPTASAIGIVNYVVTPQLLPLDKIPTQFPNLQAPTLLNPTAGTGGFNPLVSLSVFPSRRSNGAWVNNVPITTSVTAANGIIHNPAFVVAPPSTTLWSRISTDADMTYFRAAVSRGDSGQVGTARIDSLLKLPIGPNFTVFVPTNLAFQQILTAQITGALIPVVIQQLIPIITQQLIAAGATPAEAAAQAPILAAAQAPALAQAQATLIASTPDVFSNALLYPVLTAQVVKGLVVYHILGSRAFSVNFPTTATAIPTLLNAAIPMHPGVSLSATFTGPFVTAATVKGAANATPATVAINPAPGGTSDQHYLNGVLHKINQVLRPQ